MGGGVGLSAHAAHRVVTDRSAVAMPEVGIGFFPDVGASFPLARAPGFAGTYLALTGNRVGAADAHLLRACRSSHCRGAACRNSARPSPIATRRKMYGSGLMNFHRQPLRAGCRRRTGGSTVATPPIRRRHRRTTGEQASDEPRAALEAMRKASPTSLKVTLRNLRAAASFNRVEECFQQDYRIALACIAGHDFIEGIRAAIVDKDRNPAWRPDKHRGGTPDIVERAFPLRRRTGTQIQR